MFEAIRTLYKTGKITSKGVAKAVEKGLITQEQYLAIVNL